MEIKKNPGADLEKKRSLFMLAGYVVALSVVLVAFEWKTFERSASDLGQLIAQDHEEEIIPITEQEINPPPPPPPPPPPAPEINIVDDDVEIEDEVEIQDVEADQKTEIAEIQQPVEEEPAEPDFFTIVEDMPSFPGGDGALLKYIAENVKYPPIAKENGITGVVYVSYVVDRDGSVKDVKVVRGADPFLDKEAVRVVKTLKGYKPGKQRGKPVPVQFTIPIRFVLN
ncbi:MAG: energy transducer TonB [Flavobacteriales bacterium]|nr:energy transducer TonB [Flavobacteriales bacterium]